MVPERLISSARSIRWPITPAASSFSPVPRRMPAATARASSSWALRPSPPTAAATPASMSPSPRPSAWGRPSVRPRPISITAAIRPNSRSARRPRTLIPSAAKSWKIQRRCEPGQPTGRPNVTVHLYRDNGNGVCDVADALVGTTTTDAAGNYSFNVVNGTYWVTVNSKTITPSAGLNAGFSQGDVWAVQTYGSAGAVGYNGGYTFAAGSGAFYGGMLTRRRTTPRPWLPANTSRASLSAARTLRAWTAPSVLTS